jgi:hypothetical protein
MRWEPALDEPLGECASCGAPAVPSPHDPDKLDTTLDFESTGERYRFCSTHWNTTIGKNLKLITQRRAQLLLERFPPGGDWPPSSSVAECERLLEQALESLSSRAHASAP